MSFNNQVGTQHTQKRTGFTLIELLVVIAIISMLAAIPRPAELILMVDTQAVTGWSPYTAQYTAQTVAARHFEGSNIAYADGHVKWQRQENFVKAAFEANYNRILPLWRKQNQAS